MTTMLAPLLFMEGIGAKIVFVREQNLAAVEFHVVEQPGAVVGTQPIALAR
jgi:hypothetical protein